MGKTWTQAEHVPVRSTLLDIDFAPDNELEGWAVGHEGVILHTSDGGKTWELQYDGLRYGEEGLAYYDAKWPRKPPTTNCDFADRGNGVCHFQGADKPFFRVNAHNDKFVHAAVPTAC